MRYRSVTHVALRVADLRQAEEFYVALFGLRLAFREAEVADGWRTLPEGAGWDTAQAAGISLDLSVLHRDALRLALERAGEGFVAGGRLAHVGLEVSDAEMERLLGAAPRLGCQIVQQRQGLLVLDDPYGVRWELTTAFTLRNPGVATGRWLDLAPHGTPGGSPSGEPPGQRGAT
jgi:catechol 2,3-dioxygenase-like lactoylglutathione lyase family enzyme